MIALIWSNADAAEWFFLIAAIIAGVYVVLEVIREPIAALVPAAIALIALGLLAV